MTDEILINVGPRELRVALIEDERVVELEIRRLDKADLLGQIYLGRVERLAPGMEAVFVAFGAGRAGFLAARDVFASVSDGRGGVDETAPIASRLEEGQAILVQVVKEPIAGKGARLTMDLTLPGRHLAFRPLRPGAAISRRIGDEAERTRLLALAEGLGDGAGGFILRTAAEGAEAGVLEAEAAALRHRWRGIAEATEAAEAPALVYGGDDPLSALLRDHLYPGVQRILIDDAATLARARTEVGEAIPWAVDRLRQHDGAEALFERHGTEAELEAALSRRVALASGGWLAIESTEALTAIDINSGGYAGGRDPEETALTTNLEAAAEASRQLRLRAIGGLVVIDFIHMNRAGGVEQVLAALDRALARDRAPTRRSEMSAFGLVEMTRRRQRQSLTQGLSEPCPDCAGGRRPRARAIAERALRLAGREARLAPGGRVEIVAAPEVIDDLGGEAGPEVEELGRRLGCRLSLRAAPERRRENFDVYRP